jgi:hypothetical protein
MLEILFKKISKLVKGIKLFIENGGTVLDENLIVASPKIEKQKMVYIWG